MMISEALWVWKVLEHLLRTFNMMHCSNLLDKYTEVELLGHKVVLGFPGSSAGKETACNAGDSSLIPGLGSSPGEGIGYPLQYSWASLVDQTVKNLCVMQETWVRSLGWERSPAGGHGNPLQFSCLENPMDRGAWWATVVGVAKSQTQPSMAQGNPTFNFLRILYTVFHRAYTNLNS